MEGRGGQPAGPQTAADWTAAVENLNARVQAQDRYSRQHAQNLADTNAKVEAMVIQIQIQTEQIEKAEQEVCIGHSATG